MKLRHICLSVCIACCGGVIAENNTDASQSDQSMIQKKKSGEDAAPPVYKGNLAKGAPQKRSQQERIEYKQNLAKDLVHRAITFFKNNSIQRSCRTFAEDEKWQADEMYVFVIHESGVIYSHGKDNDLIWRNIDEAREDRTKKSPVKLQKTLIDQMREAASHDGWLNYEWNFEIKHVYVQQVQKDGRLFFLGTGFYPESHQFMAKQLVSQAVQYAKEYGVDQAFQRINNPIGAFIKGPIYLWAYDFDGISYANGRNLARVGRDHTDWQGEGGKYVVRDIIEQLQNRQDTWITYQEKGGVPIHAYVRRVKDENGKQYFIGGGYYPEVDADMVSDFVNRAVSHLKTKGPTIAFRDFTSYTGGFHKGPLTVFVYNMEGTILADGANPEFVGQNMLKMTDPEGRNVAREIIEKAREHGEGRTTLLTKGEYKQLYFKKVSVPAGIYIVGSGFWPDSKSMVAESLAKKAVMHMQQNPIADALRDFTTWGPDFMRGDLFIEVINYERIVIAYGPRLSYIWSVVDVDTEEGYNVADVLIETARAGGGWTSYSSQGRTYKMYVDEVAKELPTQEGARTEKFVVGVFYV